MVVAVATEVVAVVMAVAAVAVVINSQEQY